MGRPTSDDLDKPMTKETKAWVRKQRKTQPGARRKPKKEFWYLRFKPGDKVLVPVVVVEQTWGGMVWVKARGLFGEKYVCFNPKDVVRRLR